MVTGLRTRISLFFIQSRVSIKRYDHSVRVARTAARLARHYCADPGLAWLAGIFHDAAREMSGEALISFLCGRGLKISAEEAAHPVLLHGRAGAVIIAEKFPGTEAEVLKAVKNHIRGGSRLGKLEKIVYIADFIEPGRSFYQKEFSRWEQFPDIDDLYRRVETISGLYYTKRTTGENVS